MRGADLIREARLRAGLTQAELSAKTGTQRSVIARWEQGAVSPSFDNMLEVIEACGFELPLMLVPRDASLDERLHKNRLLSPERRAQRLVGKLDSRASSRAVASAQVRPVRASPNARQAPRYLHRDRRLRPGAPRDRGDHARTRHRPSTRPENLRRLDAALRDLDAREPDGRS